MQKTQNPNPPEVPPPLTPILVHSASHLHGESPSLCPPIVQAQGLPIALSPAPSPNSFRSGRPGFLPRGRTFVWRLRFCEHFTHWLLPILHLSPKLPPQMQSTLPLSCSPSHQPLDFLPITCQGFDYLYLYTCSFLLPLEYKFPMQGRHHPSRLLLCLAHRSNLPPVCQGLRTAVAEMGSVSVTPQQPQGRCQPSVMATVTQTPAPVLACRPCGAPGRAPAGLCSGVWSHEPEVLLTGPRCPSLEAVQPRAGLSHQMPEPRPAPLTAPHRGRALFPRH